MSNLASDIEAFTGLGAFLLAMGATIGSARRTIRDRTLELANERVEFGDKKYKQGRESRDDEVRQLTTERDDARHDRDDARADARDWRNQYNNLRDGGKP